MSFYHHSLISTENGPKVANAVKCGTKIVLEDGIHTITQIVAHRPSPYAIHIIDSEGSMITTSLNTYFLCSEYRSFISWIFGCNKVWKRVTDLVVGDYITTNSNYKVREVQISSIKITDDGISSLLKFDTDNGGGLFVDSYLVKSL